MRWSFGTAAALAALVAVGALWFTFAPAAVGGSADYAVVTGTSMEPLLARGDLAVLHVRRQYRAGDVVAYRNVQLGRVVLHRIVAVRNGRYLFKGDNNDFVDAPHATRAELIGSLWFRIPKAGRAAAWLHRPLHAAVAGGLLALVLLLPGFGAPARRRRRPRAPATGTTPIRTAVVYVAALVTAALGLLALVAWTRPVTHAVTVPGAYTSSGAFSYRAQAAPGTVYPSGTIADGGPVFVRLVHRLRLSFAFRFASPLAHETAGTARVLTFLTSSLGWKRVVTPATPTPFHGDTSHVTTTLDLVALERATADYLKATGVPSDTFSVVVRPQLQIRASVAGQQVDQTFAPPLTFSLDPYSLRLQQPAPPATAGALTPDPLRPMLTGALTERRPTTLGLAGFSAPVASVRDVTGLGAAVAALLALLAGVLLGERRRLLRRHRGLIVSVSVRPAGDAVDVGSFEALAGLAERDRCIILDDGDAFFVRAGDALYRYRLERRADKALEVATQLA